MKLKRYTLSAVMAMGVALTGLPADAQEMTFFRIASGSATGTYYPMAGLIAQIIGNPPGARTCEKGGNCGMVGLVAIAQSAHGSVANLNSIKSGKVESGLAQSDVAFWAYTGTGPFEGKKPNKKICVISSLYQEHLHVVAGQKSGIKTVADFKDKTIGMGLQGSGALVGARILVDAYGLKEKEDFKPEYVKGKTSADQIRDGHADAFVTVTGYPNAAITEMASIQGANLIPIDGAIRDQMLEDYRFYSSAKIPGDTYKGVSNDTETIAVNALWVSSSDLPEELHYGVVKGLFENAKAKKLLTYGHSKGKSINLETSQDGVSIPLCPGSERFYKEVGVI